MDQPRDEAGVAIRPQLIVTNTAAPSSSAPAPNSPRGGAGGDYTTNGKNAVINRPQIGFTVAKAAPKSKFVAVTLVPPIPQFAIPPNDGNWKAPVLSTTFKQDVLLTWFWPHAHMRGKGFTVHT